MDPDAPQSGAPDSAPPASTPAAAASSAPSLLGGTGAPPAAPATPAPSWVNPDGTFAPGWLDRLGPELKGHPSLATVPTIEDLAKSYVHTKGMVGKKFQAPSESSTPEEVAAWRKTVGAPDTPEGYDIKMPDGFPADQWDGAAAAELGQIAHKHHLTPAAVKEVLALNEKQVQQGMAKLQAEDQAFKEAGMATLRKEWGTNFEQEAYAAKTFATAIGLNPNESLEFASPAFVLAMARGAKMVMGDRLVTSMPASLSGGIESRIQGIKESPEYRGDRGGEAQAAAQRQLHDLYKARQPAQA